MGSFDRSKKRIHLWKKAAIHFSLCFVMGFFTGFAPTSTASVKSLGISAEPAQPSLNRSLISPTKEEQDDDTELSPRNLLIIVTTTRPDDRFRETFLMRLAQTLRLVHSPLLWIVVQSHSDAPHTSEMLRSTGIMYRHLTYKENFTDPDAEVDYQRNFALNHIEYHRSNGIVHFADVSNVYDLEFFKEIREIDVFGTWSVAVVSANRRRIVMEGPICRSSKIVGWQSKDLSNGARDTRTAMFDEENNNGPAETRPARINISGFAFNSSILWDPERWGRPSSVLDTSQDSIKFVQEVVLEDESKLKAIPSDCSKIMLWHLHTPRTLTPFRSTSV